MSIGPLDHAWSLGQEAQFYLVWPPLLLGLLAAAGAAGGAGRGAVVGALLTLPRPARDRRGPAASTDDFRIDARVAGLLAGCALALAVRARWKVLGTAGLADAGLLALLALFGLGTVSGTPLEVAVPVAVLGTVLLMAGLLSGPPSAAGRLLALPAPVFLGRISYSLYLWHYPFFRAFEDRPDLPLAAVLFLEVTLSIAAAAMSYTVVEQPLARWSARRLHR